MSNKILKVRVKKDGRIVNVYKTKDGRYNIFLGENISLTEVERGKHMEIFEENELEFLEA